MVKRKDKFEHYPFRVGDRVRFKHYQTFMKWRDRKAQEFGVIVAVDGSYIHIRPRWWKDGIIERYPCEIEHAPLKRAEAALLRRRSYALSRLSD